VSFDDVTLSYRLSYTKTLTDTVQCYFCNWTS